MTSDLPPRLSRLGAALERAAAADLGAAPPTPAAARRPRLRSRRLALAAAALAIGVPGAAFAAHALTDTEEVAQSLPAGTLALAGTNPTCTVVREGVEYHCTLERPPAQEPGVVGVQDWKGTVEPSVDATHHVNGGCRSLASDGRTWQCYIGREAVEQEIVSAGFLGERVSGPGQG
jgi:hypothetical protein